MGVSPSQQVRRQRVEQLCNELPEAARDAYDLIIDQPQPHTSRHHPLHGDLATRTVKGRDLNRWQHELTSGARLGFLSTRRIGSPGSGRSTSVIQRPLSRTGGGEAALRSSSASWSRRPRKHRRWQLIAERVEIVLRGQQLEDAAYWRAARRRRRPVLVRPCITAIHRQWRRLETSTT
jgi:hypothetical protein